MSTVRWFGGAIVLILAVIWLRCWTSARTELELSHREDITFNAKIMHAQFAMRWYTPGADAPRAAADRLEALAEDAQMLKSPDQALAAWRRLRGGILATRHLYSPFGERLANANEHISGLMASQQIKLGQATIRGRNYDTLVRDHLRLLNLDPSPHPWWGLLVFLGFLGWVGAAFVTIRRGLDAQARIVKGPFLKWLAVTAICFAAWIVGLLQA